MSAALSTTPPPVSTAPCAVTLRDLARLLRISHSTVSRALHDDPRIDWGDRSIDGIPALMVMGQYEWWEDRLTPAFDFIAAHPLAPVAFLADAGRGHFDYADRAVDFITAFIKKSAAARLPVEGSTTLRPVDPRTGWRIDPLASRGPALRSRRDRLQSGGRAHRPRPRAGRQLRNPLGMRGNRQSRLAPAGSRRRTIPRRSGTAFRIREETLLLHARFLHGRQDVDHVRRLYRHAGRRLSGFHQATVRARYIRLNFASSSGHAGTSPSLFEWLVRP